MSAAIKILLIEDDQDDYVLTADLFAEIGDSHYELNWVDNYDAGVARLLQDPPDLCLLDFRLGAKTGLELLQDVTASGCTVPIVFLTGQTERAFDVEAMKAGAAGYLIKGQFGSNPLERTIRYAIERNRSAADRYERERRQAEVDRARAAERLIGAVESIPQALALFDADDHLIQCNSAYHRLLGGGQSGSLIGRSYAEIFTAWSHRLDFASEAERERQCSAWIDGRRMDHAAFEVRTGDGRTLRTSARDAPWGGVVELIWDITDDAHREDELRRARDLADKGNAAKSHFLASVSHELRTPLNAILGFSQLLQRDRTPLAPVHLEWVKLIHNGGEHLLRLINDILELSRIEGGSLMLSLRPVRLSETLRKVGDTIGPLVANKRLTVVVPTIADELDGVMADNLRLFQVLTNFASNAVKYNVADGEVRFTVDAPAPGRVRVAVRDTGIGIPLHRQREMFQPFQRAGQETGPIEGTGIGLAISKRLAELMGGTIGFHSAPGEGSTFWIELPAVSAPARPVATTLVDASHASVHAEGDRHLVLYVEDNPANVLFILALLDSFDGIDSVIAETGAAGVALAIERSPAAIIMDINLPDMTGFEALRQLREHPQTRHIPVIALSAAAFHGDRERGEQAGFFRYLTKPVDIEELEQTLSQVGLLARADLH